MCIHNIKFMHFSIIYSVLSHFLVLFMNLTVLFQLPFNFIYNTFNKKFFILIISLYFKKKKMQYFSLENHISWRVNWWLAYYTTQNNVLCLLSFSLSHSTQSDYTIRKKRKKKKKKRHILMFLTIFTYQI